MGEGVAKRQDQLSDPQRRSLIRKEMRAALKAMPGAAG